MSRSAERPLRAAMSIAALVVAVDQITKAWALAVLSDRDPIGVVWTLQWNLAFNKGMAFSAGQGIGPIIGVVATAIAIGVLVAVRSQTSRTVVCAAGLVVGGALGNVVDRVTRDEGWLRGSVVDFIDLQWFPIFNVADMAVNVGGGLFIIWSLRADRAARRSKIATPQ